MVALDNKVRRTTYQLGCSEGAPVTRSNGDQGRKCQASADPGVLEIFILKPQRCANRLNWNPAIQSHKLEGICEDIL
jgi:hypothetical protein